MTLPIHFAENEKYISLLIGKRKLALHRGDAISLQEDALVCPVDPSLDFRSGFARVISQFAGKEVRMHRPINPEPYGKIVVLPGGNLGVKYIFLAVVLGEKDTTKFKITLRQAIERSIRYAEFLRLKSIAFPVLGSSRSSPPYDLVAKEMLENVVQYLQRRNTKLKAVLFSIYNSQAFEAFRKEAKTISSL